MHPWQEYHREVAVKFLLLLIRWHRIVSCSGVGDVHFDLINCKVPGFIPVKLLMLCYNQSVFEAL